MQIKKAISKVMTKLVPINKYQITFESLNDLDCNSGAIFQYMIDNKLNEKYKIIWLLKNMDNMPEKEIKNVKFISFNNKKSLLDKIQLRKSKYLIWDNVPLNKYSDKQISIYLTHGFPAMKNVKGIINIPENCDYFLLTSSRMKDFATYQFSINQKTKFLMAGLPRNDYLLEKNDEIKKITNDRFNKIIIWMPTFRKAKNSSRNDSIKNYKFGIPLIENDKMLQMLNNHLKAQNNLLIIKIHGGQDLSCIKTKPLSNIKIITLDDEKRLTLNLYKLIACTDALITDYSSISFDYLLINKPIGYIIDDMKEYKLGFAFEDPLKYMPGEHIKTFNELLSFLDNVSSVIDNYMQDRKKVLDEINEYQDKNNCKRIFEKIDGGKL